MPTPTLSSTADCRVIEVDPKTIARPPQARTIFEPTAMQELIRSIQSVGILHPLLVREESDQLVVVDGERRLRAALELRLLTVPVIVAGSNLDPAAILQRQLVSNCIREDLTPIEQAKAIRELMSLAKCSAGDAAKMIGKSAGHVSKLLSLLNLTAALQDKVESGEITVSAGHQLARGKQSPSEAPATKPSNSRLVATLDRVRSLCLIGIDPTLEAFRTALEELLNKTKAAAKQGIELDTFLSMLRDQARA